MSALVLAGLLGCGDSLGPEDIAFLRYQAGDDQIADAGTAVAEFPSVLAVDDRERPIPGVVVAFTVTEGGGSVATATATTDETGIARIAWTLGVDPGPNVLVASTERVLDRVTFTATGVVGPPAIIERRSGEGQTATAGRPVDRPPSVIVTDQVGNPVDAVTVTFAPTAGGGTITGGVRNTDPSGIATLGSWTLGPDPGLNTLTASVGGVLTTTFTATGEPGPTTVTKVGGDAQEGSAGASLPIDPQILTTDARGNPVSGVSARFVVIDGGGSLSSATAVTNASGVASVEWTLGTTLGLNQMSVQVADLAIVTFSATSVPGPPAQLVAAAGVDQSFEVGRDVPIPPAVRVMDAFGNPVSDVEVQFAVTGGGGSITGASPLSGPDGVAAVTSWTLGGTPGPNTITATVGALPAVEFVATALAEVYSIELVFLSGRTPSQEAAFLAAVDQWEEIVVGDLPDESFAADPVPPGTCGVNHPVIDDTVDDLRIFASIIDIDGPGNVLGQAGPCFIRDVGFLTVVGVMQFDAADLGALESSGLLQAVVVHEMGHVLGIGSLWEDLGFLQNPSLPSSPGADTHFNGANAVAAFDAVGGDAYVDGDPVPVENELGGSGTRDSHWREGVFERELMTGFINNGVNPLSIVTVESLRDIGYVVNAAAAEPYELVLPAPPGAGPVFRLWLGDDVWRGPVFVRE